MASAQGLRLHLEAAHEIDPPILDKMVEHMQDERGAANEYAALGRIHKAYHATEYLRHSTSFGPVDGGGEIE